MDSFEPAADIHQAIVEFAASGRAFALALVLRAEGHTPCKAATQALIDADGAIHGTVGGGVVEAEAQRRAVDAIRTGHPIAFDVALTGESAKDAQPICGGRLRILVDPTAADRRAVYAQAAEAVRKRRRSVLVTTVRSTPVPQVTARWLPEEAVATAPALAGGDAIRTCFASETPQTFAPAALGGDACLEGLVEPLVLPPLLVIAGGGHVGQAVARQAGLVGFAIVVIDDRAEFTAAALYPEGTVTQCGDIAQRLAEFPVAGDTYVVVVTRGHQHDQQALAACIRKPAAYIGMIGSRRKVALIRQDLCESGVATDAELARVYAPIGLDIGAQTVPEIATSIVAQVIAVRRQGGSPRMPTEYQA